MAKKKFFAEMAAVILKAGIAVFLLCGLASCWSMLPGIFGNSVPEAVEIVYEEIAPSELADAIRRVDSPGHGFIVEAYLDLGYDGADAYSSLYRRPDREMKIGSAYLHDGGKTDSQIRYVEPPQFEIYRDLGKRIDRTKQYKVYIGIYYRTVNYASSWEPFIDKIEGLHTLEEVAAIEAQQKAEAEAKRAEEEATAKAEKEAEAAAKEAKFNPNKLDRSQYKEITVEDFSFDMAAGNLPVGTKVAFKAKFFSKPTGTSYRFQDVGLITLSSTHNFVRDMPDYCFGPYQSLFGWIPQTFVKVYATVKKSGQTGEASVEIVEW
jgi:hypothetical protein